MLKASSLSDQQHHGVNKVDYAIIGAGTAGCFMACLLKEAGETCALIEKSRGLGGRCSRRRLTLNDSDVSGLYLENEDTFNLDLGAASFSTDSIKQQAIKDRILAWQAQGVLSNIAYQTRPFHYDLSGMSHGGNVSEKRASEITALPSLNTWHKHMAAGVETLTGTCIKRLARNEGIWHLFDEEGLLRLKANRLIITCPAEQTLALYHQSSLINELNNWDRFKWVETQAGRSLGQYVCAIKTPGLSGLDVKVYQGGHPILARARRVLPQVRYQHHDGGKPQAIWFLESNEAWAKARFEQGDSHQTAARAMAEAFRSHFDISTPVTLLTSHFWRLARHQVDASKQVAHLFERELNLGICGDWLDAGDIAGALNSAQSLFDAMHQDNHQRLGNHLEKP